MQPTERAVCEVVNCHLQNTHDDQKRVNVVVIVIDFYVVLTFQKCPHESPSAVTSVCRRALRKLAQVVSEEPRAGMEKHTSYPSFVRGVCMDAVE